LNLHTSPYDTKAIAVKKDFNRRQTHVNKGPSHIKRADKTKRRKRHLQEPARLKTPKEGSTKGRKREREANANDHLRTTSSLYTCPAIILAGA
jgi:hypothetical protein